jgi:thiosulfate/3-mercaptopyruvate sulfurtransferase
MNKFAIAFMLSATAFLAMGADKPILVDADWLSKNLSQPNLVILQVNFLKIDYDREHIENARYLWPGWLAPDSPQGAMNVPNVEAATTILRDLGINQNSHVILCHTRSDVTVTARIFLTLEHLGLRGQVSFLNGGLEQWKKSGYKVTAEVPLVKKGYIKLTPGALIVDKEYVLEALSSPSAVVVDARATRFYDGEPTGNPRDGHITRAKNIPFMDLVDEHNRIKSVSDLEHYFAPVEGKKEIVVYCFIGQTASVVYMAGRILARDIKLYDGSLEEWSRIESLPMELTPKQP